MIRVLAETRPLEAAARDYCTAAKACEGSVSLDRAICSPCMDLMLVGTARA